MICNNAVYIIIINIIVIIVQYSSVYEMFKDLFHLSNKNTGNVNT